MVSVTLGGKAKNYDFDVSDIKLKGLMDDDTSISVGRGELTIAQDKRNYVTLEGDFKFGFGKGIDEMIRSLDAITVVQGGKQIYSVSGLDLTKHDIESAGYNFKQWLAEQNFTVKGNAFGNELVGAVDRDLLHGLSGSDSLFGLDGNDKLFGDGGNDILNGGMGNDRLTGGSGFDTFVFAVGDGLDTIADFAAKARIHDVIDLSAFESLAAFEDLSMQQVGKNVVIDLGGGDAITLRNVTLAHLDAADFLF